MGQHVLFSCLILLLMLFSIPLFVSSHPSSNINRHQTSLSSSPHVSHRLSPTHAMRSGSPKLLDDDEDGEDDTEDYYSDNYSDDEDYGSGSGSGEGPFILTDNDSDNSPASESTPVVEATKCPPEDLMKKGLYDNSVCESMVHSTPDCGFTDSILLKNCRFLRDACYGGYYNQIFNVTTGNNMAGYNNYGNRNSPTVGSSSYGRPSSSSSYGRTSNNPYNRSPEPRFTGCDDRIILNDQITLCNFGLDNTILNVSCSERSVERDVMISISGKRNNNSSQDEVSETSNDPEDDDDTTFCCYACNANAPLDVNQLYVNSDGDNACGDNSDGDDEDQNKVNQDSTSSSNRQQQNKMNRKKLRNNNKGNSILYSKNFLNDLFKKCCGKNMKSFQDKKTSAATHPNTCQTFKQQLTSLLLLLTSSLYHRHLI